MVPSAASDFYLTKQMKIVVELADHRSPPPSKWEGGWQLGAGMETIEFSIQDTAAMVLFPLFWLLLLLAFNRLRRSKARKC